jgi:hypothetical protein
MKCGRNATFCFVDDNFFDCYEIAQLFNLFIKVLNYLYTIGTFNYTWYNWGAKLYLGDL